MHLYIHIYESLFEPLGLRLSKKYLSQCNVQKVITFLSKKNFFLKSAILFFFYRANILRNSLSHHIRSTWIINFLKRPLANTVATFWEKKLVQFSEDFKTCFLFSLFFSTFLFRWEKFSSYFFAFTKNIRPFFIKNVWSFFFGQQKFSTFFLVTKKFQPFFFCQKLGYLQNMHFQKSEQMVRLSGRRDKCQKIGPNWAVPTKSLNGNHV